MQDWTTSPAKPTVTVRKVEETVCGEKDHRGGTAEQTPAHQYFYTSCFYFVYTSCASSSWLFSSWARLRTTSQYTPGNEQKFSKVEFISKHLAANTFISIMTILSFQFSIWGFSCLIWQISQFQVCNFDINLIFKPSPSRYPPYHLHIWTDVPKCSCVPYYY